MSVHYVTLSLGLGANVDVGYCYQLPVITHAHAHTPVHVLLPPWYDAVVALPSGKHVNGVLEPVE